MYSRLCKPLKSRSFFLFGPRGTGKSHLVKLLFSGKNALWIDLLNSETYQTFMKRPALLEEQVLVKNWDWVIIDEVQKVPALLDHVHRLIETSPHHKFILTGSSARKLKKVGTNLLAGRAFVNRLHPLTYAELGHDFILKDVLNWGTLPTIYHLNEDLDRQEYLRSYCHTYIKEEIKEEQIVRSIEPFVRFLEVAAQMNGKILNYSKIARDCGASAKAVERYYEVLTDTLLGFFLEPYNTSVRKRQVQHSKFYFFDIGVTKALANQLTVPTQKGTYLFGDYFEQLFILECLRLNDYHRKDFRFSFFRSKDDLEVDLIVERPGKNKVLIEIKSAKMVDNQEILKLKRLYQDLQPCEFWFATREPVQRVVEGFKVMPWDQALHQLFA